MASKDNHPRTWAMVCHLATFAGWVVPLGNIFGPLVAWLAKRDKHSHINDQGREAVNFNITVTVYGVVLVVIGVASFVLFADGEAATSAALFATTILGAGALTLFHFIFTLIAAHRAYHGTRYRYPLTIRFIK